MSLGNLISASQSRDWITSLERWAQSMGQPSCAIGMGLTSTWYDKPGWKSWVDTQPIDRSWIGH